MSPVIAPLDAELLLAYVLRQRREFLLANPDKKLDRRQARKFLSLIKKRARGVPLAYLTGHKEFFGLDFIVNKSVLIPRPETETLVEATLNEMQKAEGRRQNHVLLDIGTGSGCVPIAIMKAVKHKNHRPRAKLGAGQDIQTLAIDISRQALRVAQKNARRHGVRITFLHGDLLNPFIKGDQPSACLARLASPRGEQAGCQLLITANLPYLTAEQYAAEPSIQHEPQRALIAKDSGLGLYNQLLRQIKKIVTGYGLRVTGFFEIDHSQSQRITTLIQSQFPQARVQIKKDLAGHERVVKILI